MPCFFNLFHAMHFTVYCMPGSPWCGQTFTSPMPCIRFYCSNHVVQLTLLRCFPVFSSGFACARWENVVFAFRPRGVEQLLYPCRVTGPRPLKLCARSHSGITWWDWRRPRVPGQKGFPSGHLPPRHVSARSDTSAELAPYGFPGE
jgi:hypothetical protein